MVEERIRALRKDSSQWQLRPWPTAQAQRSVDDVVGAVEASLRIVEEGRVVEDSGVPRGLSPASSIWEVVKRALPGGVLVKSAASGGPLDDVVADRRSGTGPLCGAPRALDDRTPHVKLCKNDQFPCKSDHRGPRLFLSLFSLCVHLSSYVS